MRRLTIAWYQDFNGVRVPGAGSGVARKTSSPASACTASSCTPRRFARGEHDGLPGWGLVGDLLKQVADDVQPGALLVVGVSDVPGSELGVGRAEHLITGPGYSYQRL